MSLAKLGFAANILKVEEWEVKIDYPERQEKEKSWSREMCQWLYNPTESFIFQQPQREFTLLYTEQQYKRNTTFCSQFSWAELKVLRLFLCTQQGYFFQILFTSLRLC